MLSRISISRDEILHSAALLRQSPVSADGMQLTKSLASCEGNTFSPMATKLIDSINGPQEISLTMTASTPLWKAAATSSKTYRSVSNTSFASVAPAARYRQNSRPSLPCPASMTITCALQSIDASLAEAMIAEALAEDSLIRKFSLERIF